MEERRRCGGEIPELALECVMGYVEDPVRRDVLSRVCKRWYHIDSITRKHVTIALCYSITPARLRRRFPRLESLKLKGKPRASMYQNLIPSDWGGYAGPWINEIAGEFVCLKAIHFRRMIVADADIRVLIAARGHMLQTVKLDKCSGFSTDSLLVIARSCRSLRILFLEESEILQGDGNWLHELAVNNSTLELLNFYLTDLSFSGDDLELLARNCRSLASVKISECDLKDLVGFFSAATALVEFVGGCFDGLPSEIERYQNLHLPATVSRLGLQYMKTNELSTIFPLTSSLKKLDLQWTLLSTEDHCLLIQRCPNLEILEVRNVIGDRGLEVVAQTCKKLRRLRIERGEDEQDLEDEQGMVSHRGLSAIAQGCLHLEYIAAYIFDITNAALECFGTFSKNMLDFRLVLLEKEEKITDLPVDNGVRALLRGCTKIQRFALYLRAGGLTDQGLAYISENSQNIRYMLLGFVGNSDRGLLEFSRGCPDLQKLELRGCCFSEHALALAVTQFQKLRYIWVQGYQATLDGRDLMAMARPFWNIEFIPPRGLMTYYENESGQPHISVEHPAQVFAYYSLAGRRTDCPETVVPLYPDE